MVQNVVIQINEQTKNELVNFYSPIEKVNNGQYVIFFAQNSELTLTVYAPKKDKPGIHKVFFSGKNALKEAKKWDENAKASTPSGRPTKAAWEILDDQIGSDEVGTGDFFGPICVCAAYVKASDMKRLKELGVDDSKRLTDEQIVKIGSILIKEFDYSQISLPNEKYNELNEKNMNMNEMKAKMHNRTLLNLVKRHPSVNNILQDQFAAPTNYFKYLKGEPEIVRNIKFKTKGETYFPSVAVGSIIARYSFIQHMQAIGKKYGVEIPFGAGPVVNKFAKQFVKEFGIDELNKIVKKNFANYEELTK